MLCSRNCVRPENNLFTRSHLFPAGARDPSSYESSERPAHIYGPWVSSSLSLRGGRLRGLSLNIQAGWLVRSKLAVPSLRRLSGSFLLKRRCAAHCRSLCFCQIVKMCLRWTRFRLDKLPDLACWEGESVLPAISYLRSSDKEPKSTFLVSYMYEREKFVRGSVE